MPSATVTRVYCLTKTSAIGFAAFGTEAGYSSPRIAARVAATWPCVTGAAFIRSPSGGVSGPRKPIQMNSAPFTFSPWSFQLEVFQCRVER